MIEPAVSANPKAAPRRPIPKDVQVRVFQNDRWLCRWCLRPVVFAPAMRFLQEFVRAKGHPAPVAFWNANWRRDLAPLLDGLGACIDHIHAHAKGGTNDPDNLATICSKCNVRKGDLTAEQHLRRYMRKPVRGKHGEPQHWDGLSSVFVALVEENPELATATEKAWAVAFKKAWASGKPDSPGLQEP